ncbi:MAG: TPM domain-containing protein [Planctomycetota bacterium]|nr:TPM domain-containing protein [Planctomycetota bacterium]
MQLDTSGFRQVGAQASWDKKTPDWAVAVADFGPWIFAAVVVVCLVRALVQGRRYSARDVFGANEQSTTHQALVAAEARTTGEIVPVVLERSDAHSEAEWMSALAAVILGSLLLAEYLPWHEARELLSAQLALGALGFALARFVPGWKRMFVSEKRASDVAEKQAVNEFHRLGLSNTHARTGVLLFVSLFERRVVVLGDAGIHAKVGDEHWSTTRSAILKKVRRGRIDEGLVDGIRASGDVLAEHFPWTLGDRNELPDRVVVRRE